MNEYSWHSAGNGAMCLINQNGEPIARCERNGHSYIWLGDVVEGMGSFTQVHLYYNSQKEAMADIWEALQ